MSLFESLRKEVNEKYQQYLQHPDQKHQNLLFPIFQNFDIFHSKVLIHHNLIFENYEKMNDRNTPQTMEFLKIISKCRKSGTQFIDPDFHPQKILNDPILSQINNISWKRYNLKVKSPLITITTPNDIVQGYLGDCYFVSVMIAISNNLDLVNNLFLEPNSTEIGVVIVNFYFLGKKISVLVDTQVPYINDTYPLFTHPRNDCNSWWFMMVEKAYAKFYGSYTAIIGGTPAAAFYRLLGTFSMTYSFTRSENQEEIISGLLFKKLSILSKSSKAFLCANSKSTNDSTNNDQNLILGHAYTILRVDEIYGNQLIQLRNPWGNENWNGDWGNKSDKWTKKMRVACGYEKEEEGIFWMSYKDFINNYASISICEILDSWDKVILEGIFQPGENDGASPTGNGKSALCLPQFLIKFKGSGKRHLKINIEQLGDMSNIGIAITMIDGKKADWIYQEDESKHLIIDQSVAFYGFEWELSDISGPWTLIPYRPEPRPGSVHWVFTIYSDHKMEVSPLN